MPGLMARSRPTALVLALLLALVAAACTRAAARTQSPPSSTTAPTVTTRPSTTTTLAKPRARPRAAVTLAFAGDVHFEGRLRSLLAADPDDVLAPIAPTLRQYDIAMVNLETAITQRGQPETKAYTFRASASALRALTAAGIDVATEANNHGVDYGPEGLADTLAARGNRPAYA